MVFPEHTDNILIHAALYLKSATTYHYCHHDFNKDKLVRVNPKVKLQIFQHEYSSLSSERVTDSRH